MAHLVKMFNSGNIFIVSSSIDTYRTKVLVSDWLTALLPDRPLLPSSFLIGQTYLGLVFHWHVESLEPDFVQGDERVGVVLCGGTDQDTLKLLLSRALFLLC